MIDSYAMDKYSPCNVFFASQTTLYTSNGIDGTQTKMVPFLFYPKGRNVIDDVDKVIDHRYKYKRNGEDYDAEGMDTLGYYSVRKCNQSKYLSTKFGLIIHFFLVAQQTNKISFVLVGHSFDGELQTIEALRSTDFDLCAAKATPASQNIRFGENIVDTCTLDLRALLEVGEQRPWLLNLYLNYTENGLHLMKAVPVLIRNAFSHNMVCFSQHFLSHVSCENKYFQLICVAESVRSRAMAIGEAFLLRRRIFCT